VLENGPPFGPSGGRTSPKGRSDNRRAASRSGAPPVVGTIRLRVGLSA
jgi:hypothetical protein